MAVSWPAFLQAKLNEAGFGISYQDNVLRSNNETGVLKTRARTTKRSDTYTSTITIDIADYQNWDDFFTVDLNNGVTPFEFNHPFTGVLTVFKFLAPPKINPLGGTSLTIDMAWAVVP